MSEMVAFDLKGMCSFHQYKHGQHSFGRVLSTDSSYYRSVNSSQAFGFLVLLIVSKWKHSRVKLSRNKFTKKVDLVDCHMIYVSKIKYRTESYQRSIKKPVTFSGVC